MRWAWLAPLILLTACSHSELPETFAQSSPGVKYSGFGVFVGAITITIEPNGRITKSYKRGGEQVSIQVIRDRQLWRDIVAIIAEDAGKEVKKTRNTDEGMCDGGSDHLIAYAEGKKAYSYYEGDCGWEESGSDLAGRKIQQILWKIEFPNEK